ncbi:MAG: rhodanese-like domain-containing protein [Cyanobacteriota/Melainabacteria group bacterium]|nr:sulfurtransferase [Candidatus Obscuribacterales bacterium]
MANSQENSRGSLLVTVEELLALGSDCLVVDARPFKEFQRGHIPGAVHIGWEDWNEKAPDRVRPILHQPGYWGKLANLEKPVYIDKFRKLGVDRDRPVVVYAGGRSSKGREGRVAWMLIYAGVKQVAMLDGGLKAWKRRSLPLQTEIQNPGSSSFVPELKQERRILHQDLTALIDTDQFPRMLDTRSEDEFSGKRFWYQPKKGRIPEAHLVVFNDVFTDDGHTFIEEEAYKSLLPKGYQSLKNIGTYCEVGVRTCTVALLHEHYTGTILPVYDGSIMEWTFDNELPILTI